MAQIVLDAEAFKALSSDTRLQILKALDARRLTVSEIGRLLNLNKATVFEHLKQLAGADLVKKEDEGRKWVYYKLTWKGKNVLHPENVQFMLLLGTAALSVGGLVAQLGKLLDWWGAGSTSRSEIDTAPTADDMASAPERESDPANADTDPAQTGAPAQTTTQGTVVDDGDSGVAPPASDDGTPFWQDPNWWLLGLLIVLLVATGIFAYQYVVARRRERRQMLVRIQALPPEPESQAL